MANATPPTTDSLLEALDLLRRGAAAGAESLLTDRLRDAQAGPNPDAVVAAQANLGAFLLLTDRPAEAVAALRAACAASTESPTARRARAEALLHLGQALELAGQP